MIAFRSSEPWKLIFRIKKQDTKTILQDITILQCTSVGFGFIEKDHRHIVTGDLRITVNNKLMKLLSKVPKYRETNNIS